jgi:hypothetical protein
MDTDQTHQPMFVPFKVLDMEAVRVFMVARVEGTVARVELVVLAVGVLRERRMIL